MKKILTAMFLICLVVGSGHVYSHDIGVKSKCNVESVCALPVEFNAVASAMSYEMDMISFGIETAEVVVTFEGKEAGSDFGLIDVGRSRSCYSNYSLIYKPKTNITYAIAPGKLYLEDNILKYPIVKASPLPKAYLLPLNRNWCFGSEQRNC